MKSLVALAVGLPLLAVGATAAAPPLIGDYDAELRDGDHVDNQLMVQRLTDLGANTYMWLLWHSANDWDDLHDFLPLAREAGISVWVYLVPHSESGPTYPYSEPYRLDYVRWAQEIAKLSLEYDNLVGYVIDDFWGNFNPEHFSVEYIKQMVAAGKAISPQLKFYPLMYYGEFGSHFARDLAPLIDGVVAAYNKDRADIENALRWLNDEYVLPSSMTVVMEWATKSSPGDHAFISQQAKVTDAAHARLKVHYRDDYDGVTTGYHVMQIRVDDQVVWEEDTGGADQGELDLDLSKALAGKTNVTLSVGVDDKQGVSSYGIRADFWDLRLEGLELVHPDLHDADGWKDDTVGPFTLERHAAEAGSGRYHLPLIAMIAGNRGEFELRHGGTAVSERIAEHAQVACDLLAEGKLEGVVMYCLDKTPGNPDLEAVRQVFAPFVARRQAKP